MTPERANDIGYLLDNFEECAVAAHAEQTDSADERLRSAAKAITDLVERLTAELAIARDRLDDEAWTRLERDRDRLSKALTDLDPLIDAVRALRESRSSWPKVLDAVRAVCAALDALDAEEPAPQAVTER